MNKDKNNFDDKVFESIEKFVSFLFNQSIKAITLIVIAWYHKHFVKLPTKLKVFSIVYLLTGIFLTVKVDKDFIFIFVVYIAIVLISSLIDYIRNYDSIQAKKELKKKYEYISNLYDNKVHVVEELEEKLILHSYVPYSHVIKIKDILEHNLNRKIESITQDRNDLRTITINFKTKKKYKTKYYLKDYINIKAPEKMELPFLLGIDLNNNVEFADLAKLKHILISGESGGGKSTIVNSLLMSLMYDNNNILYLDVDFKWVELKIYEKLNNTIFVEEQQFYAYVDKLNSELDRRKKLICDMELQNIKQYNKSVKKENKLPYIVFLIDEVSDIKLNSEGSNKEVLKLENKITRILNQGRALGIICIFATQKPSSVQLSTQIRDGLCTKLSFRVGDEGQKQSMTGITGTENLKEGEFYFKNEYGQLSKYKAFYVDRQEEWTLFENIKNKLGVNVDDEKIVDLNKYKDS